MSLLPAQLRAQSQVGFCNDTACLDCNIQCLAPHPPSKHFRLNTDHFGQPSPAACSARGAFCLQPVLLVSHLKQLAICELSLHSHTSSSSSSSSSSPAHCEQHPAAASMPPNLARPFAGLESVDFTGLRLRLIDAENQVCATHVAECAVGTAAVCHVRCLKIQPPHRGRDHLPASPNRIYATLRRSLGGWRRS